MSTLIPRLSQDSTQRTEEVADIIDKMPTKFGYYATAITLFLVVCLFSFGWLIKYPDIQRGAITITTRQAPVKIVSNLPGILQLIHKSSGQIVKENEYIAVLKNAANPLHVKQVDSLLRKFQIGSVNYQTDRHLFPESLSLGELSNKYFSFLNALYQYLDYFHERPYVNQKYLLQNLSSSQNKNLQQVSDEITRLKAKYELTKSLFSKDSALFSESLIPQNEFEKSKLSLLASEQEFENRYKEVISSQYQITDANSKIKIIDNQRLDKERELGITLVNSYFALQEGISQWELKYVFKSPIPGKVEFLNFLRDNDYIMQGQHLFSILPDKNEALGQIFLPTPGAGKVKPGQKVIIKLDDYPYAQYGALTGRILDVSQVANEQVLKENKLYVYLVNVSLPEGLKTNYGSILSSPYETKGIAEIITDDRRLIERFFSTLQNKVSK